MTTRWSVAVTLAIAAACAAILCALYRMQPLVTAAGAVIAVLVVAGYIIQARRWDKKIDELARIRAPRKDEM